MEQCSGQKYYRALEAVRESCAVLATHNPPRIAKANGIDICYEIFGEASAEPLVLIMGLAGQMVQWDDAFCEKLAARGFRVIRFDNRDTGQSSKLAGGDRLTLWEMLKL